jgi:transcriptional regulator with XRE-family HTH domain
MKFDYKAIDREVGRQVRLIRLQNKMTQYALADHLGISFQQMQKYETGQNRISASRLFAISQIFACSPDVFFCMLRNDSNPQCINDLEAVEIAARISQIKTPKLRKHLKETANVLFKIEKDLSDQDQPSAARSKTG